MTSKPRCKYWDACYRSAPAHLAAYEHPTRTKKRITTDDTDCDKIRKRRRTDTRHEKPKESTDEDQDEDEEQDQDVQIIDKEKEKTQIKPIVTRKPSIKRKTSTLDTTTDAQTDITAATDTSTPISTSTSTSTSTSAPTSTSSTESVPASSSSISLDTEASTCDTPATAPHPLPRTRLMSSIDSLPSPSFHDYWLNELKSIYGISMSHDLIHMWEGAIRYGKNHGVDEKDQDTSKKRDNDKQDKGEEKTKEQHIQKTEQESTTDTHTDEKIDNTTSTIDTSTSDIPLASTPYISPAQPFLDLMSRAGLALCGPFDIMAGKWGNRDASRVNVHMHYRYWYDPPEMMTVLRCISDDIEDEDVKQAVHYGYWRDDPSQTPTFLVHSAPGDHNDDMTKETDIKRALLTPAGSTIYACIVHHLRHRLTSSKSMRKITPSIPTTSSQATAMRELLEYIINDAKQYGYDLNTIPEKQKVWKERQKRVIASTLNGIGLIVPVVNDIGYRPLPLDERGLIKMLNSMDRQMRYKGKMDYEELDHINNLVSYANDECDPGMGLELGIALFCATSALQRDALRTLSLAYQLLHRPQFESIIESHLTHRHIASSPHISQLR